MVKVKAKSHSLRRQRAKKAVSGDDGPAAIRIARVAKGKKPQYFADPATDKLLWMTISLMQELSVTRDRLDTVERLLERGKLLRTRDIEDYAPTGQPAAERDIRRAAYIERVMRALQAERDDQGRADKPEDDPVAAVSA